MADLIMNWAQNRHGLEPFRTLSLNIIGILYVYQVPLSQTLSPAVPATWLDMLHGQTSETVDCD